MITDTAFKNLPTGNITCADDFFEEVGRTSFSEEEYETVGRPFINEMKRLMAASMKEDQAKYEATRRAKAIEEGLPMPADPLQEVPKIEPVRACEFE